MIMIPAFRYVLLSFIIINLVNSTKTADSQLAPLFRSKDGLEDRYIVVFKETATRDGIDKAIKILRSSRDGHSEIHHKYSSINGFAASMNGDSLNTLLRNKQVKYIEQDSMMRIFDKCVEQPNAGWCLERVNNVKRTNRFYYPNNAGKNTTVYVIDTGVNAKHSDFQGRATQCANFVKSESGEDINGHGTGVASLVAGSKSGIAKFAHICGIKVLNGIGSGSTSDIIAGINWVTNQKKKGIVNLSLGGGYSRATNDAVNKAFASGHFVVVAAGNEAQNACNVSPASAENAFTIAASDENNNLAKFSNFGSCVNLIAPGVNCVQANSADGKFKQASGTSFASPLVAGVAAALKSKDIRRSPVSLKNQILANAAKNEIKNVKGSVNLFVQTKCL